MANEMDKVRMLREKTSAGIVDCKSALTEAKGDIDKAIELLRKKGISLASRKSSRSAKEGVIASYIHSNGKIGVLLELNCETDFVARNDDFKNFAKDLTMQIAAANPAYINKEDVPQEIVDKEKDIIREQNKKKPEKALDKIVEGKINGFYKEACLMEQPFIKDPKVSVNDLFASLVGKIGEKIVVKRFVRYQLGETA